MFNYGLFDLTLTARLLIDSSNYTSLISYLFHIIQPYRPCIWIFNFLMFSDYYMKHSRKWYDISSCHVFNINMVILTFLALSCHRGPSLCLCGRLGGGRPVHWTMTTVACHGLLRGSLYYLSSRMDYSGGPLQYFKFLVFVLYCVCYFFVLYFNLGVECLWATVFWFTFLAGAKRPRVGEIS